MPTTGYLYAGSDIGSIFGAKGPSTAATTGYQVAGTDLNQILLALSDGQDIGFDTGYQVAGTDFRHIFGAPSGALPVNGKAYSVSAIYASSSSGSLTFGFTLTSSTTWATYVSRTGTTNGSPSAGNIDTGTIPAGAAFVRYTLSWLNASGDTGAATATSNGASSSTAIATNVDCHISMNGNGTSSRQTTYNFKVEFLNASSSVISTTNFTSEASTEGTA